MNLDPILRYLAAGRGRPFEPEERAVWADQLQRSGFAEVLLMEAARRYVARAKFFTVSECLQDARELAKDRADRESTDRILRIGEGVSTVADAKACIAKIRRQLGFEPVKTADAEAPPLDVATERERQKRALKERG